jgi:hypothetical protein
MESLILRDPASDPVTRYLHTFVVPALRLLQIPESFLGPKPIDSLASFSSKSGCKKVHITGERSVSQASYRKAFPSIPIFSFSVLDPDEENSGVESDFEYYDVESNSSE